MASWARCDGALILDGFTYDRIIGGPTTLAARADWLRRGAVRRGTFIPSPTCTLPRSCARRATTPRPGASASKRKSSGPRCSWPSFATSIACLPSPARLPPRPDGVAEIRNRAKTLPSSLRPEAEQIAQGIERLGHRPRGLRRQVVHRLNRWRLRAEFLATHVCGTARLWRWLGDRLSRWTIGYGFAPQRSLYVLAALIGVASGLALLAWQAGDFAPGSDVIVLSDGWQSVRGAANPAGEWSADTALGGDWEGFSALAYGFDLVVPLIEIGQTASWVPSTERGPWGAVLWWARWVLTVLGWAVTALGAAAVTGIVQRGRPE